MVVLTSWGRDVRDCERTRRYRVTVLTSWDRWYVVEVEANNK
jgi:hypothetical protein